MSNEEVNTEPDSNGFPELTALGKQLEVLRIDRGLSKQRLARVAGTSRQQLWRVMTGKCELTGSLRQRLADVLRVDVGTLGTAPLVGSAIWSDAPSQTTGRAAQPVVLRTAAPLDEYLADTSRLERTLGSLPSGDAGRELKRALLNALEDQAVSRRITLGPAFFDVRRRVLCGEL